MTIQTAALTFLGVIAIAWLFSKLGKSGGLVILIVAALLVGVWSVVHSVQSFTGTVRVATIQASPIKNAPHMMAVSLTTYDSNGNATRAEYELSGERWEITCDVVRYQDFALWLGLQSAYSCDRITSQYDDSQAHTVQPVALPRGQTFAIPFLERSHYRSGVLEPADGVVYNVFVTIQGDVYASPYKEK